MAFWLQRPHLEINPVILKSINAPEILTCHLGFKNRPLEVRSLIPLPPDAPNSSHSPLLSTVACMLPRALPAPNGK